MKNVKKNTDKIIIGWQEIAKLPQINIPAVKVKIDTGARTSSIHAENIEYFTKNKKQFVRFTVHPIQRNKEITIECEAPLLDTRNVKSSSGHKERRPVIETMIQIGKHSWKIQLNLTNRDYMGFRMLLGRNAMNGIFVDPTNKMLQKKLSRRQIIAKYLEN